MWGAEKSMQQAWSERLFDQQKLATVEGRPVRLIESGLWNYNQGPDFLHGRIAVDGMEMHGDIELHLDSRDWFRHGHHMDKIYDGVVLHVVMDKSPCTVFRSDGSKVPTMSLAGRVPEKLGLRAEKRASASPSIPCESAAKRYPEEKVKELLESEGKFRVQEKVRKAREALDAAGQDWEEAVWRELMAVLGGPVNAGAFRELATTLPFRVVRKYARSRDSMYALLFGIGGLIGGEDERIRDEWNYLAMKHFLGVQHVPLRKHRMRPVSFPGVRLGQASALLESFPVLTDLLGMQGFHRLKEASLTACDHGELVGLPEKAGKALGADLKASLAINVLLPFGALFGEAHGKQDACKVMVEWLKSLPPEDNKLTRKFIPAGWKAASALESQGMIRLDRDGCSAFGCMACPVWRNG